MKKLVIDYEEIEKYRADGKTTSLYVWLTWQFNGAIFLDAGTRAGSSAKDFSYNPDNFVLTFDVDRIGYDEGRLLPLYNVMFKQLDVNLLEPTWMSKVDVILMDISHNGNDERKFLKTIEDYFKGILIMDDINDPERFPKLHDVWNSIDREKYLLLPPVGACKGTGIIPYGDWTIEVREA